MKHLQTLLLAAALTGCTDQLALIQDNCRGMWRLESRQLPDGTLLKTPVIEGELCWITLDQRKAHVTLSVRTKIDRDQFDFAASVYEISSSAITRNRHLLVRRGYRPVAAVPLSIYGRARKTRGVIKILPDGVELSHEPEAGGVAAKEMFAQTFRGDQMVTAYSNAFTDTLNRVQVF